ncbi:ComEC/Rec2 family competence protein [bacterium]|nr:ComEC/Rec2 family competence protein [bacterium]
MKGQTSPLIYITLLFIAGILLETYLHIPLLYKAICVLFLLPAGIICLRKKRISNVMGIILLYCLTIPISMMYTEIYSSFHQPNLHGRDVQIKGIIIKDPVNRRFYTDIVISPEQIKGLQTPKGLILVRVSSCNLNFKYGDKVLVFGKLSQPYWSGNIGTFNYRKYLERHHTYGVMKIKDAGNIKIIARNEGNFIIGKALTLKNTIKMINKRSLPDPQAAMLNGILLGMREDIPQQIFDMFRKSGIVHILAVSGLHVGLILLMFWGFLKLCRVPKKVSALILILLVILYCMVTGMRDPIFRTTIMALAVLVAIIIDREQNLYISISLACLVLLFINPYSLFNAGFQLSFIATLGIICLTPILKEVMPLERIKLKPRFLFIAFAVSLSAQISVMPIVAYHFNYLSLWSVFTNILILPIVACILALGLLASVFGTLWIKLAYIFSMPNWILLTILLRLIEIFSSVNFMYFEVQKPYITDIIGYYTLIAFALYSLHNGMKNRKLLYILALVLLILFLSPRIKGNSIEIVFPHSPDGDIVLIKFPCRGTRNKIMLITSDSNKFNNVEKVIQPLLWTKHISKIDYLFLNRVSDDHLGAVVDLSKNFDIKQVLDIAQSKNSFTYKNFRNFIEHNGLTYRNIKHEESILESSEINCRIYNSNLKLCIVPGNIELLITPDCVHMLSIQNRKILIYQRPSQKFSKHKPSIIKKHMDDKDIYSTDTHGTISIKVRHNKVKILCSKKSS